jgi:PAS domain-containing protein
VTPEQHPVEVILARAFVSNLVTPAFLVDAHGTLVFYNEAAADLLGVGFEEAGPMPAREWVARFDPGAPDGSRVPLDELPLTIALRQGRPAHRDLQFRSADGDVRTIEVTAFPIVGHEGQHGAIAIFWSEPR